MKLSQKQYSIIQSVTLNYFKNIGQIEDIKIKSSEEFINIMFYPKSLFILNSIEIEEFSKRLKENIIELKPSSELMTIEFDVINKCISFSISF